LPDALRYRFASGDEIPALARLAAHSFPGAVRTPAYWLDYLAAPVFGGGVETLFVGSDDRGFAALLQLHPLRQWIGGAGLPCAGVGTVVISPAHRRRGLGAELVRAALIAALERGDIVSALYPFRSAFYGRLGYGAAGEALQWQVAPEMLPDAAERRCVAMLESAAERAEARALYNRWIRGQNGQMERGAELWERLLTTHDRALAGYRSHGGRLEGYALVTYRADAPARERALEVDELVWTTPAARHGLFAWLASLGDQWHQLLLRGLPAHRIGDWLREPRLPAGSAPAWGLWAGAATLLMGPMFRLLDARAAWEQRGVAADADLTVALEVSDEQIPRNASSWRLALRHGSVAVEDPGRADVTIRTGIATLSRLYAAALTPTAAFEAGLLECDGAGRLPALDAALALPEPWTFDRF
jgi:predicted acetyltransferase